MKKFGTREEVINSLSKQTRGGLTKRFLKYNAEGKIISVRRRKQRGGALGALFNNKPDNLSSEFNIGTSNENTDLAKMYKEIHKVNPTKKLIYDNKYLIVDGDITYQDYIKFIYNIIIKNIQSTTIDIRNIPSFCYKYNTGSTLFLINVLECSSSDQMIKSVQFNDITDRIDITTLNATFYTKTPDECGVPDIDAIISELQSSKGGNPSHIQTGKRGGRFVMVGGRRRYLRK